MHTHTTAAGGGGPVVRPLPSDAAVSDGEINLFGGRKVNAHQCRECTMRMKSSRQKSYVASERIGLSELYFRRFFDSCEPGPVLRDWPVRREKKLILMMDDEGGG